MAASVRANGSATNDAFARMRNIYVAQYIRTDSRPAKIIEHLYLGSVGAAYSKTILKARKITHILTVCEELPPKFPAEFSYHILPVSDEPTTKLSLHFKECLEFIHSAIEGGGEVLVHCFAGVSRSASVVIAYLMRYKGMGFNEALWFVRGKRPWVNPNFGFMGQLRRYDSWLFEQRKKGALN